MLGTGEFLTRELVNTEFKTVNQSPALAGGGCGADMLEEEGPCCWCKKIQGHWSWARGRRWVIVRIKGEEGE